MALHPFAAPFLERRSSRVLSPPHTSVLSCSLSSVSLIMSSCAPMQCAPCIGSSAKRVECAPPCNHFRTTWMFIAVPRKRQARRRRQIKHLSRSEGCPIWNFDTCSDPSVVVSPTL